MLLNQAMKEVANNLVSETTVLAPPNHTMSDESCAIILAEIRWLFKRSEEWMDDLARRCDQSSAGAGSPLDGLGSEKLPMETTASGGHPEATTSSAVAAACVGISITAQPIAASDATDHDIDDELHAPAASTITKEVVPVPDLSAAASSANDDVPSDVDIGAPANCSTQCLRRAAGVPTSVSAPNAAPISSSTSPFLVVNIWSPAATGLASLVHVGPGTLQVFDEMPLSHDTFPIFNNNMPVSTKVSTEAPASPATTTAFGIFMLPGEHLLHDDSVVLSPALMKCVKQQPWPPPADLEFTSDAAELRPMPWPSFNMVEGFSVMGCFDLVKKLPWSPPARRTPRLCRGAPVIVHELLPGLGCELIIGQKQRECGGICWPALFERIELKIIGNNLDCQVLDSAKSPMVFSFDAQLRCSTSSRQLLEAISITLLHCIPGSADNGIKLHQCHQHYLLLHEGLIDGSDNRLSSDQMVFLLIVKILHCKFDKMLVPERTWPCESKLQLLVGLMLVDGNCIAKGHQCRQLDILCPTTYVIDEMQVLSLIIVIVLPLPPARECALLGKITDSNVQRPWQGTLLNATVVQILYSMEGFKSRSKTDAQDNLAAMKAWGKPDISRSQANFIELNIFSLAAENSLQTLDAIW